MIHQPEGVCADFKIRNTLATESIATFGICATSTEQIITAREYAKKQRLKFIALGEGSNIISHKQVKALVCQISLQGIEILHESKANVILEVAAGENWHRLVQHCTTKGWYGLENLSLIPGSVGAAPVQNIGAYGIEVASFIESVTILNERNEIQSLSAQACGFSYRESIFKKCKDKIIVSVTMRLTKNPAVVIEYAELKYLLAKNKSSPTPADVASAVMALRSAKLPDPQMVPNVGSFFKNPVISSADASRLRDQHPDLKMFHVGDGVKLSAAQLLDQAGWKERQEHGVKCWRMQPLVLTNSDNASAMEILQFAETIQRNIQLKYGVALELEPYELS